MEREADDTNKDNKQTQFGIVVKFTDYSQYQVYSFNKYKEVFNLILYFMVYHGNEFSVMHCQLKTYDDSLEK